MGIEGKVAVVTGGGRGIGQGIARGLLDAGAIVIVTARTADPLDETVELLREHGPISRRICDVSDHEAVRALFDAVDADHGGVDIMVCSHGVLHAGIPLLEYPVELWDETIAINLKGTFLACQAAARVMVRNGCHGRLINISSIVAIASAPHETAYDASKGGVEALTRAMALDLAPHSITVNSVAPGWIRTPMIEPIMTPEVERTCNPLRRFGEPAHVASAVVWLADPGTSQVTAATIVVDGGQRAALAGNPLNA
jgi:NAD(P)-dependent dehydrogenase (short-subunit alcohol dehydrogenase family)